MSDNLYTFLEDSTKAALPALAAKIAAAHRVDLWRVRRLAAPGWYRLEGVVWQ